MSNIPPNQFLSQLLESRALNSVTAEPLFTYQLQQNEYQALKQVVVTFLPKTNLSRQKHLAWAACFVLWCSEWYRRECKLRLSQGIFKFKGGIRQQEEVAIKGDMHDY